MLCHMLAEYSGKLHPQRDVGYWEMLEFVKERSHVQAHNGGHMHSLQRALYISDAVTPCFPSAHCSIMPGETSQSLLLVGRLASHAHLGRRAQRQGHEAGLGRGAVGPPPL